MQDPLFFGSFIIDLTIFSYYLFYSFLVLRPIVIIVLLRF